MMDYDIPSEHVAEAVALTPGIESPTVLAPASRGLGRGARDGSAAGRAAADGRALRHRRPRHPAHRHPCLPSLSRSCPTPGDRSASGWQGRSSAERCWWCARSRGSASTPRPAPASRSSSAAPLVFLGLLFFSAGFAMARSRVVAETDRLVVVNGYRTPRLRVGRGAGGPPAAGRPLGGARPRRRHQPAGDGHPGLRRRTCAPGRGRAAARCSPGPADRGRHRPGRRPGRRRAPGCDGAAKCTASAAAQRLPVRRERVAVAVQPAAHPHVVRAPRPTPAR